MSSGPEHIVQFYEKSEALLETAARFLAAGLSAGETALVVATGAHRDLLRSKLEQEGLDLEAASRQGRFVALDASETLQQFQGSACPSPDGPRFFEIIGDLVRKSAAASPSGRVRVFGEMVAVLCADGNPQAAIEVETLWNELARRTPFALLCAYPLSDFASETDAASFGRICGEHSHIIPAESYTGLSRPDERHRAIAELQQKARSLEEEVAKRKRTERALRARERELSQADRRKNEFLATLGHELRNPLSPIVTTLELLHRRRDPATIDRSIEIIERQTRNLTRLVDDLLDISRITRGKIPLQEETIELAAVVQRAVEQARPTIDDHEHHLEIDIPAASIWARVDAVRLEQVLANLLINAARYTDRGGRILLAAHQEKGDLVLSVRDNGIGLTPEIRDRVFDLFLQSPSSSARAPGGLGVGLTLVRRLIELHGGTVEARSDGPGCGSEFVVRLPGRVRSRPPARGHRATERLQKARNGAGQRRILVVDDNSDITEGLADLLRTLGHDVHTAGDGADAIAAAGRFHPQVVFLDISMPGLDGHEVARRLRSVPALRSSTLVALTGYGQDSDRELSREAGFDHHLVKPIGIEALEELLSAASPA